YVGYQTSRNEISTIEIVIDDVDTGQVGSSELGSLERSAREVAALQRGKFEIDARQVGTACVQPFQIGGFQDCAHQAHRLVAHVGTQICIRDRSTDEARAGEIGSDARA